MHKALLMSSPLDGIGYEKTLDALRTDLVNAQYDLHVREKQAVVVLLAGISGGGRSETANKLNEWMDPRHIVTRAFDRPSAIDGHFPPMWRYWQALPPRGRIGIALNGWYYEALSGEAGEDWIETVNAQEAMFAREGVVLLKFWFHLNLDQQRERLRQLESDRLTRWRVSDEDRAQAKHYNRYCERASQVLAATDTAVAPWHLLDASDEKMRDLMVGRMLLDTLRRSSRRASARPQPVRSSAAHAEGARRLHNLDLSLALDKDTYEQNLADAQARFAAQVDRKKFADRSLVLVFEGQDAAGKGSAIRRVTHALDTRQYSLIPIAAPNDEERARHYLWRFWKNLPERGRIAVFDRSWYGRVLVERVEGLCSPQDCRRAYEEINSFEHQLIESGVILLKFWLQISKAEQLRRFRAREKTPFKRFKITPDDWRNRRKWAAYDVALSDMLGRTSTSHAPWTLVEAEDKRYARVKILQTLADTLRNHL